MTTDEDWRAPGTPAAPSPVLTAAIGRLEAAYDALLSIAPTTLSDEDVARLVDATTRLADRSAGAVTAAVGEADHRRLGDAIGARHTGQWWARRSLLTRPEAHRLTRLGRRLGEELYAPVQAALAGGEVHTDQAAVIVRAVEAIPSSPDDLPDCAAAPAVLKARAVEHLLVLATDHDAQQLKRLGRRILDTVAPAVGEAAEAKALADEEAAAARTVTLTLRDTGHGTSTGRFTLPTAAAEMLRKQLMAIAAPQHQTATQDSGGTADRDDRPLHARLGWAFVEWIERYRADLLPTSGGTSATVVVTMPLGTLQGGLAAASLDTPVPGSAPGSPVGWRARPGSSPPSSAAGPRSSTWAAPAGSTPGPNASPSPSATAAAPPRAATCHPQRATSTTTTPGPAAGPPTPTPAGCCATATTVSSTTSVTRPPDTPTARSASTDGRRPTGDGSEPRPLA